VDLHKIIPNSYFLPTILYAMNITSGLMFFSSGHTELSTRIWKFLWIMGRILGYSGTCNYWDFFFQQSSRLISPTLRVVVLYLLPKEGDLQQIQIDSLCHCLTPTIKSCLKCSKCIQKKKRVISRLIVNAQTFRIPERYIYDLIFLVRLNYFWSNCISSFWVAIPKSGKNHFTVCIIPSHMELIPKQDLQKIWFFLQKNIKNKQINK